MLELASLLSGPLLTRKLGHLGAEVVKVEAPSGDSVRTFPPHEDGHSLIYEAANRGKKSVVLDLRAEGDRDTFLELASVADAIVESYRPGALAKLGINWATLREQRPDLVICSLTGFGQDGPLAQLPAHGMNIESLAGCAAVTKVDGQHVFASDYAWALELGALHGALATSTAVLHAKATGQGAWLDVSCWDAGVEAQRWVLYPMLAGHDPNGLAGKHGPGHSIYEASDGGLVALLLLEQKFWAIFCTNVGREDLIGSFRADDFYEGTDSPEGERLRKELASIVASAPASEWLARFAAWGVTGCHILTPADVVAHPHLAARQLVGTSAETGLPWIAEPVRNMDDEVRLGFDGPGAPRLGADTDDVLERWLGGGRPETRWSR